MHTWTLGDSFFFPSGHFIPYFAPSLSSNRTEPPFIMGILNDSSVTCASDWSWRTEVVRQHPIPSSVNSSPLPHPLLAPLNRTNHRERKKRSCSFEQICATQCLTSATRSYKATRPLTIHRCLKVVCNGFISSNI